MNSKKYVILCRIISVSAIVIIAAGLLGFFKEGSGFDTVFRAVSSLQFGQSFRGALFNGSLLLAAIFLLHIAIAFTFGRVYCSSLCPLGALQDGFFYLGRFLKINNLGIKKNKNIKSSKNSKKFYYPKYITVSFAIGGLLLGLPMLFNFIEPYSVFARAVTHMSLASLILLGMILACALYGGRIFCNGLCPVGAVLGLFSRSAFFRMTIAKDGCTACAKCERLCKANCIDMGARKIDNGLCVMCGDCMASCPMGAFSYTHVLRENKNLREVIGTSLKWALSIAIIFIPRKFIPNLDNSDEEYRVYPVTPPGSLSLAHLKLRCTSCGTCIAKCPSGVLVSKHERPGMFIPVMDFKRGFCQYDCNYCSQICPPRAIYPLSAYAKKRTQAGFAEFFFKHCISTTHGTACGACAEHCPTGAVQMSHPHAGGMPIVTAEYCIGCGACEYACPAIPAKAIAVTALPIHGEAKIMPKNDTKEEEIGEFRF